MDRSIPLECAGLSRGVAAGRGFRARLFSPDGRFLATSSVDGTVRIHIVPVEDLIDMARDRAVRTLTDEECRRYLHVELCPV